MQRQQDAGLRRASKVGVILAVVLVSALSALTAGSHPALAGANNVYGHSWYITNPTASAVQSLAEGDATWANQLCNQYGSTSVYTICQSANTTAIG